jgi:ureidoglycolate lyase
MAGLGFLSRSLVAAPLEARSFANYGEVVDVAGRTPELINDGTTERYADLLRMDVVGRGAEPVLAVYVARARSFPLAIERLERHREASQVFMPLGDHRFIVVVAPGREAPEWDAIRAFITAPGQGVALKRATWHHGLVALGDGDRFAVIEGANYREDTVEVAAPRSITLLRPV